MLNRRQLCGGGGLMLAAAALPRGSWAAGGSDVVEIGMRSDADGAHVWFDPIGLLIRPGQTVRWVNGGSGNVHTATAYHPDNAKRALRIPEGAKPWDSGYLVNPGDRFEVTLTVEGTYDYFCAPHEAAGMVGRIIVGRPGGPGSRPFGYFRDDPAKRGWLEMPEPAQRALPRAETIMARGTVRIG